MQESRRSPFYLLTRLFASFPRSKRRMWLTAAAVIIAASTATVGRGASGPPDDSVVVSPVPMVQVLHPGVARVGGVPGPSTSSQNDIPPTLGAPGAVSAGLIINATFDSTITSDPNAAAIEAAINTAIANTVSMFSDPITVNITFKKMTSGLGQSSSYFATVSYSSYLAALKADAKTSDDATAIGLLPNVSANPVNGSTTINVKTANLRAVGINANPPPGQPDGIISLNTTITSPGSPGSTGTYNLLPVIEHEMDELLGLGSALPSPANNTIFPEDLYRYTPAGTRTFTTTSSVLAFFSIDGTTRLAQFDNQNDGGDFGDWQSNPLPAGVAPKVQDAFATPGANPALGVELTALDVIGYNRVSVAHKNTIVVDLGPAGVWLLDNGPNWTQLNSVSPVAIVTGDLDGNGIDEIICDFGPSYGIWVKLNNASWFQLHPSASSIMAIADLDGNGKADLIAGFPGLGTYIYYNNSNWVQLQGLIPSRVAAGNIDGIVGDDLVLDFGAPYGIYLFKNNSTWQLLHPSQSVALAVADIDGSGEDDIIVSLAGGAGTWAYKNNSTWSLINSASALRMAAGNIDGDARKDLVLDFGAPGLWFFYNGTTFSQLLPQTSEALVVGDWDRNGKDDVVVDLGPGLGLWIRLDSGTWVQGNSSSPEILAMAHLH